MKAIRYEAYGEPADVLRLEEAAIPLLNEGHVAVRVHACGLNPADWALCRGLSAKKLPSGIGLDVSGLITAIGEGVTDVAVGDAVFGPSSFMDYPTAGASDYAILYHWDRLPDGLSHVDAAALPMVVETAARYLSWLAAEGLFLVPIARTFALEDWREALDISVAGRARGKLVLLPSPRVDGSVDLGGPSAPLRT
ncbi:hypothetical protein EHS25_009004 [Saitozyma podzolica]|uniref:Enoyl reductase (ER) domain-containing protein n=1 Tax=Saitozyma podzolica TaxID=1890683 RepID=A0A427YKL8_9TREE|nr:hypothetical protein EHS25_009004 [Saitozyma podzolica]